MKYFFLILCLLMIQQKAFAVNCEQQKIIKSFKPEYAKNFSIDYYEHFKVVTLGTGKKLDKVIVREKPLNCQTSLFVIKQNIERFVATSTTHLAVLKSFKLESKLVGFQGTQYIFNPKFDLKKIKNISYQLNSEELFALKPDLIMAYESNIPGVKTLADLRKLNLPVVLNWDFAEYHPLARAEWSILIASFFGEEEAAQDKFKFMVKNYERLKQEASAFKKVKVLVGAIQGGKWVTTGGKSDLGILINDAAGELVLGSNESELQYYPLEKALSLAKSADLWLPQNEWQDLKIMKGDSRYQSLRNIPIYGYNKLLNKSGYNDYWETGVSNPALMLKDLVSIFHPQLTEKLFPEETIWYKQLK